MTTEQLIDLALFNSMEAKQFKMLFAQQQQASERLAQELDKARQEIAALKGNPSEEAPEPAAP